MAAKLSIREMMAEQWRLARELRHLTIRFTPENCTGIWQCYDVCPVGCWEMDDDRLLALFSHGERCIACGACVLQCPRDAISLELPE